MRGGEVTITKKILIVDDDPNLRLLVSATLEGDPRYRLLEAGTGETALEIARKEKPDLILLDIAMPGIDGFNVCRTLKADPETRHITVVMLTALGQEADRKRGMDAGADSYFTKPFSPTALLEKVEEVLGL